MSTVINLNQAATQNDHFRTVLFTGEKSQLVVMRIPVSEDIGEETHAHVEQILYILSGQGVAVFDGKELPVGEGSVAIVTPGTRHNIRNTGTEPLVIATVYVPPNHLDGTIHRTKADAQADSADESFGEAVE